MGKKRKKPITREQPFVSVCTPTYNRRIFISQMVKNVEKQDYPKDKFEWIIIDDGSDPIEDLLPKDFETELNIKYYRYEEKIKLGKKRNLMHEKSSGEILVYMDDDDYYPPDRISHAVKKLQTNPDALCAGSSIVYLYFNDLKKIYQFGPYGPKHATAGTFAFRKKLLDITSYEDDADMAEEKHFLKNYTIPFVQLDPVKTILVFAHQFNTFDKRKLLKNPHPNFVRETKLTVKNFLKKNKEAINFYINV
jgi:glycosyltransferase involved in cell wall biosynthesis|uniref:Glycosyltransferase 2-like domain-containing protein n=1 Tax=viral metagenome TaxID=1070528 RepID=A0A6C0IPV6_9ZZZZ